MRSSDGVAPEDVAEAVLWTRRGLLGVLGGGAAVLTVGAGVAFADDCPEFRDDAPDYIQIVNVKRLGAVGRGSEKGYTDKDDTDHIERALSWSRNPGACSHPPDASGPLHPRAVYFPAGTYLISRPIDVQGCRLIGEPLVNPGGVADDADLVAGASGSIIKAMSNLTQAGEKQSLVPFLSGDGHQYGIIDNLSYKGIPLLHVPRDKRATNTGPVWLENLTLDAAGHADHALYLFGAGGRLDAVSVMNAKMSNLLTIESAIEIDDLQSHGAGRTGVHLVNSSGTVLNHAVVTRHGTAGVAHAIGILVERDANEPDGKTKEDPGGHLISAGGIRIRGGHIGTPSSSATGGAGVAIRNVINPGVTSGVTIDGVPPAGVGILLDGSWSQTVENCSITLTGGGSAAAAVELRTGTFGTGLEEEPRAAVGCWVRGNWSNPAVAGRGIVVGEGCSQNRFSDNLSGTTGMSVTGTTSRPDVPSERNHATGHGQVINHSPDIPTGTWKPGDIVFNTKPKAGGPVGWVWTDEKFVPFGYIGADAQINQP